MTDTPDLAAALKAWRGCTPERQRGTITQRDAAELLGISYSALRNTEITGKFAHPRLLLNALAAVTPSPETTIVKSLLDLAIVIATEAHAGQLDKGGQPYILHPLRVMLEQEHESARIVGVLHDVVEDCPGWPLHRLDRFFPLAIITALMAVTRQPGEDYMAFCRRAGANSIARGVKIADLRDNLLPNRQLLITEKNEERLARYRAALAMLEGIEIGTSDEPKS